MIHRLLKPFSYSNMVFLCKFTAHDSFLPCVQYIVYHRGEMTCISRGRTELRPNCTRFGREGTCDICYTAKHSRYQSVRSWNIRLITFFSLPVEYCCENNYKRCGPFWFNVLNRLYHQPISERFDYFVPTLRQTCRLEEKDERKMAIATSDVIPFSVVYSLVWFVFRIISFCTGGWLVQTVLNRNFSFIMLRHEYIIFRLDRLSIDFYTRGVPCCEPTIVSRLHYW